MAFILKIADKSYKKERKPQTFKSHSGVTHERLLKETNWFEIHLFTGQNESNFYKNIFVVHVRNLAIIRKDCPVNLLKEVKKALMVMQIGTMKLNFINTD